MREFIDRDGTRWDVVLGRESWGAMVLLFVPAGSGQVRQAAFPASSYDTGVTELDELSTEGLQQLLDASQPKPD